MHGICAHSQLQQSQIGIAVECSVLALLDDVVLEYCGGFGVVPVEAAEDGLDVGGASVALVENEAHLVGGADMVKGRRREGHRGAGGLMEARSSRRDK